VKGKIGLEEHFALHDTLDDSRPFVPGEYWPELESRLLDVHERRLALMDRHGMEMMILSLNAPAVQAIPEARLATSITPRTGSMRRASARPTARRSVD